jgi:hypothetical protein
MTDTYTVSFATFLRQHVDLSLSYLNICIILIPQSMSNIQTSKLNHIKFEENRLTHALFLWRGLQFQALFPKF